MITCNHSIRAVSLAAAIVVIAACDGGSPSRTADEFAADSALAADLALANRDTLLVDSIGEFHSPEGAERDAISDTAASVVAPPTDTKPTVRAVTAPTASPKPVQPAPPPPAVTNPAPTAAPAPAPSAPRLTGTRACASPTQENQSECLHVLLASADSRMNRIYRALITEIRRQEKVAPGAKDPASVQRLRVAQRAWVVYRDTECRKRSRPREGALWARPRVRCLGQFANRRANELADNFSRITAH
ncbi:MAG: lysozyme inhibitor LprI family protein [Gemmatimonadales bacterium]